MCVFSRALRAAGVKMMNFAVKMMNFAAKMMIIWAAGLLERAA